MWKRRRTALTVIPEENTKNRNTVSLEWTWWRIWVLCCYWWTFLSPARYKLCVLHSCIIVALFRNIWIWGKNKEILLDLLTAQKWHDTTGIFSRHMKDIKYITVMWRPYQSGQHDRETPTRNINTKPYSNTCNICTADEPDERSIHYLDEEWTIFYFFKKTSSNYCVAIMIYCN